MHGGSPYSQETAELTMAEGQHPSSSSSSHPSSSLHVVPQEIAQQTTTSSLVVPSMPSLQTKERYGGHICRGYEGRTLFLLSHSPFFGYRERQHQYVLSRIIQPVIFILVPVSWESFRRGSETRKQTCAVGFAAASYTVFITITPLNTREGGTAFWFDSAFRSHVFWLSLLPVGVLSPPPRPRGGSRDMQKNHTRFRASTF